MQLNINNFRKQIKVLYKLNFNKLQRNFPQSKLFQLFFPSTKFDNKDRRIIFPNIVQFAGEDECGEGVRPRAMRGRGAAATATAIAASAATASTGALAAPASSATPPPSAVAATTDSAHRFEDHQRRWRPDDPFDRQFDTGSSEPLLPASSSSAPFSPAAARVFHVAAATAVVAACRVAAQSPGASRRHRVRCCRRRHAADDTRRSFAAESRRRCRQRQAQQVAAPAARGQRQREPRSAGCHARPK